MLKQFAGSAEETFIAVNMMAFIDIRQDFGRLKITILIARIQRNVAIMPLQANMVLEIIVNLDVAHQTHADTIILSIISG